MRETLQVGLSNEKESGPFRVPLPLQVLQVPSAGTTAQLSFVAASGGPRLVFRGDPRRVSQ